MNDAFVSMLCAVVFKTDGILKQFNYHCDGMDVNELHALNISLVLILQLCIIWQKLYDLSLSC